MARFKSINAKLVLLISLILSGAILAILFATERILVRFQRKSVEQDLQQTELLVNALITSKLAELKVQSQLVGELPILNSVVENGEINTLRDVGKSYRENLRVPIFDILGRDGGVLASIGEGLNPQDTSVTAFSRKIMETGSSYTILPRGDKLALLAGSIIGTEEDAGGVLLLGVDLDSIFADRIREYTKAEITFLRDGRIKGSSLTAEEATGLESLFALGKAGTHTMDRTRYLSGNAYALKTHSLRNEEGAEAGQVTILLSLFEHHKILSTVKYSLIGIGIFVFLAAWGLSFRFSFTFTKPIADAVRFAQKLAAGDRNTPIEINRSDELGTLQESLERMRVALKEFVENLDAKVKDGIRHVTNIQDNLDSGFLIFDSSGIIQPGYSRISEEYFGKVLAGQKIEAILSIGSDERQNFETWKEVLFGGMMPFKDAAKLGPQSYEKLEGKFIELTYRPITSGKSLQGVILIATDRTLEKKLSRKFELQKEKVDLILKISANPAAFIGFVEDSREMIRTLEGLIEGDTISEVDAFLRLLHTLKGNSAMYHFAEAKDIAQSLEDKLSGLLTPEETLDDTEKLRSGLASLREALEKVLQENKALVGDVLVEPGSMRRLTVHVSALSKLEKSILAKFGKESEIFGTFMETLILDPFIDALRTYEDVALEIAGRRGKCIKPIEWKGSGVKVRISSYKRLIASLVHAFRNAVDHGIELPEDREAESKDAEGRLWVIVDKTTTESEMLLIRIGDDGKGIDPEAMRRKIVDARLLDEDSASQLDPDSILQYAFKNGFTTSETVSDISGRGVGLDAIAYEAGKLGGRAWIKSAKGVGTELFIEVPVLNS